MNKVAIVCAEEKREQYSEFLSLLESLCEEKGFIPFLVFIKNHDRTVDIIDKIRNDEVVYIISLDMSGFEMKTLLEDAVYNIITVKQLHIIIDPRCTAQMCKGEFALNLYLCLPRDEVNLEKISAPNILEYSRFERNEKGYVTNNLTNQEEIERIYYQFVKDIEG